MRKRFKRQNQPWELGGEDLELGMDFSGGLDAGVIFQKRGGKKRVKGGWERTPVVR